MNKFQLFSQLQTMTDPELVAFASEHELKISPKEAKALRKVYKHASLHWLIHGIPTDVRAETKTILGEKRYKKLMRLIM